MEKFNEYANAYLIEADSGPNGSAVTADSTECPSASVDAVSQLKIAFEHTLTSNKDDYRRKVEVVIKQSESGYSLAASQSDKKSEPDDTTSLRLPRAVQLKQDLYVFKFRTY